MRGGDKSGVSQESAALPWLTNTSGMPEERRIVRRKGAEEEKKCVRTAGWMGVEMKEGEEEKS